MNFLYTLRHVSWFENRVIASYFLDDRFSTSSIDKPMALAICSSLKPIINKIITILS
ncbi:MAG: hypothetical protein LBG48_05210 [Rickettsiales bacterium]|nr:hypothetical protein [Rickettsiales bacterium]